MDIEKLIERLRTDSLYADKATLEIMDLCMEAAGALSTLQAENASLRKERDAAVEDVLMPPLRLVRTANMARLTAEFAIWTTITTKCFRVGSGAARRRGEHGETDILV